MNRSIEIMEGVSDLLDKKNISSDTDMTKYKEDFFEMSLGSIKAIAHHAMSILKQAEANDEKVKNNLTESWLQGKIAITEDYMRTIHDFVMFVSWDDDDTSEAKTDRPDPKQWKELTKTKSQCCDKCGMAAAECCCSK